jgi:hypothetical protein
MKLEKMKLSLIIIIGSLTMGIVSCNKKGCTDPSALNYNKKYTKDDGSCTFEETTSNDGTINKSGNIVSNETWTSDKIYILSGKVIVNSGVTLTIEPGTIIKGAEGTGTLASALVIAQGAKINAVGTASQPIIFTSVLDNIAVGQLTGTNLDENNQGLWGGIIMLGYAPISAADGDVLSQIEGIPASDSYGAFGGSNTADNSGTLSYVSIRHGGALIGAGNEINGLTLGGVGSGTIISNIEVVANLDDGIEFFGGTVNVTNVLIGFQGDDGLDIDMNYAGTITNFVVINGSNSDESLEIDGPEGTTYTSGLFNLVNGTTNGNGDFKSKAQGTVTNVKLGTSKIRASYQNACADPKTDAFTYLTQTSPTLKFINSEFATVSVYTASDDGAAQPNTCSVFPADQTAAENVMNSTTSTGFNSDGFATWTWIGVNGKL